jgi:hypothetical protein
VGFGVYAAWCDSRGVDPGIGDSWFVPLGSGYRLAFVDIADQAFLESPTKEQFDLYTRGVGFDSQTIYFEAADHTYQLIEKANGRVSHGLSESALAIRLQSLGQPPASLRPPSQIYDELRWSAQDLLAVPIVFGVPMVLSARVGYYVWTVRKRSSQ